MLAGRAFDDESAVLIVENTREDRDTIIKICREVGFLRNNIHEREFSRGASVATELNKAIGDINRGAVDLVLLDLALDEADEDVTSTVLLLEQWTKETQKKKIPVIVVSGFINELSPAARKNCFAAIRKPGSTDGEQLQFSDYLKFAIQTAITQRSDETTPSERIRRQVDRLVERFIPGNPHIHVAPGVSYPVKNPSMRAFVAVFVVGCWALGLYAYAKSHGWPTIWISVGLSLLGLILLLWFLIPKKPVH